MIRSIIRSALTAFGVLLSGCNPVAILNTITPTDSGARRVATDIAYGPESRQRLDIYLPYNAKKNTPVLMFVYGGSWKDGAKKDYAFVGHAFASRGYATVLVDYRLVPDVVYPSFVEDAAAAFAWTKKNIQSYGGNPNRIFVAGHSAGAYNSVMLAVAPEFLAAHQLKPTDIAGVIGLSGPYSFLPLDVDSTKNAFGHVEDLKSTQPVNRATEATPPIFLIHGLADTVVSPKKTKMLAKHLLDNGRDVQTQFYDNINHAEPIMALSIAFRKRAPLLQDSVDFMGSVSER